MKFQVCFKIINPEFSKERYDWDFEEERDGNYKYLRESKFASEAESVEIVEKGVYLLEGHFKDGPKFSFPIIDLYLLKFKDCNGNCIEYGVSNTILNKTHIASNTKYGITRYYFYINSKPASRFLGTVLLDETQVPEPLINGILIES